MKLWIVGGALALALGIGTSVLRAESVTLQTNYAGFVGLKHNLSGFDGSPESTLEVTNSLEAGSSLFIGAYNWNVMPAAGDTGSATFPVAGASIYTFCIEKTQGFIAVPPPASYPFTVNPAVAGSPLSVPPQGDVGAISSGEALALQGLFNAHWPEALSNDMNAAAFQLAVWEIEYDGSEAFNASTNYFGSGNIQANATAGSTGADAIGIAVGWLNALQPAASLSTLVALNSDAAQDHLTAVVPLPPALWAGASMLLGMFAVRKFRQRASRT
jgi:hypothetical protein